MALANENIYAIDPNELKTEQQIDSAVSPAARPDNILDPGFNLTLRPMRYQVFFDMYKDCLLYTSPSPRDRQKSRMPSSA